MRRDESFIITWVRNKKVSIPETCSHSTARSGFLRWAEEEVSRTALKMVGVHMSWYTVLPWHFSALPWRKQAHLPSHNSSQHSFAELFPFEMWIYCLQNIYLASKQYVTQSATALSGHMNKKESEVERYCSKCHCFVSRHPFIFERFWFIRTLWPFV